MRKLVIDNTTSHNTALLLLGRIFVRSRYRALATALMNCDMGTLEFYVREVASELGDVDEETITGTCRLLALALEFRPINSLQYESEEVQLGRIHEFCMQSAKGVTDEMQGLSLDELPAWLRRR